MEWGDHKHSGQGAAPPTGFPEAFTNSFRGLLLGALLGDVRNADDILHSGPIIPQVCWALDALIKHRLLTRAQEQEHGFDPEAHPLAPTDHLRQGLLHWGAFTRGWADAPRPSGWLSEVPALRLDRGPAPAEDFAQDDLRGGVTLSSNDFRTPSALFRSLPIAASSVVAEPNVVSGWCATAAGLTHGHPEVWSTTALVGLLVGHHLTEVFRFGPWAALDAASTIRWFFRDMPENPSAKRLLQAVSSPLWSRDLLAALSPDDTSVSVLAGALYLFERARTLRPASIRVLAASAADPHAVASLAAALVGLEQGPRGLDTGELTRHELSWVVDTLARDFCVTIWSPPAYGGEMDALAEMSLRYPRES